MLLTWSYLLRDSPPPFNSSYLISFICIGILYKLRDICIRTFKIVHLNFSSHLQISIKVHSLAFHWAPHKILELFNFKFSLPLSYFYSLPQSFFINSFHHRTSSNSSKLPVAPQIPLILLISILHILLHQHVFLKATKNGSFSPRPH